MAKKTTPKKTTPKKGVKKPVSEDDTGDDLRDDDEITIVGENEEDFETDEEIGEEEEEEETQEQKENLDRLKKEIIAELRSYAVTPTELKNVIQTTGVVIVDFWADWCGPCLQMAQLMKGIFAPYLKFHPNVRYVTIDSDKFHDYGSEQGIDGIPAFKVYVKGKKVMFEDKDGKQDMLVGSTPFHFGEFLRIAEEYEHSTKSVDSIAEKKKSGKTK